MLFLQDVDIKTAIYQVKQWKKVDAPHLIDKKLREDAVSRNVTKETCTQFLERIFKTVLAFSIDVIDQSNESMPRYIDNIIKCHGQRRK